MDKEQQKKLLTEIMEADEKDGLYKQQTSLQWLEEQLNKWLDGRLYLPPNLFEQAKQMEKEQIMDAHIEGQRVFDKHPHTHWTNDQAEQYYNEMIKKK